MLEKSTNTGFTNEEVANLVRNLLQFSYNEGPCRLPR
jgi:hypothetical protein